MKKYAARLPAFTADGSTFCRSPPAAGTGACCAGPDLGMACIARDITEQTLFVKQTIHETGGAYLGLTEDHLFDMEFRAFQRAKVVGKGPSLRGGVALVTGAAGAIGSGICDELLRQGCNVAVTDLAGEPLDAMVQKLKGLYGDRVLGVPLNVTESASVAAAFERTAAAFGGIDILVINAGLAHVSSLTEMDLEAFRALERVNIEGTLLLLAQAGKLFQLQTSAETSSLFRQRTCSPPAPASAPTARRRRRPPVMPHRQP